MEQQAVLVLKVVQVDQHVGSPCRFSVSGPVPRTRQASLGPLMLLPVTSNPDRDSLFSMNTAGVVTDRKMTPLPPNTRANARAAGCRSTRAAC